MTKVVAMIAAGMYLIGAWLNCTYTTHTLAKSGSIRDIAYTHTC